MAVGTTITTGQILGTSVLLKIDTTDGGNYVSIGLQKNATLNMGLDAVDVSNKDSTLWREYIPGYKDWSVDCDSLIVETDTALTHFETHWLAGQEVTCVLATPANVTHWGGKIIIKSMKYTAPDGGVYTAALTLQGTGSLGKT